MEHQSFCETVLLHLSLSYICISECILPTNVEKIQLIIAREQKKLGPPPIVEMKRKSGYFLRLYIQESSLGCTCYITSINWYQLSLQLYMLCTVQYSTVYYYTDLQFRYISYLMFNLFCMILLTFIQLPHSEQVYGNVMSITMVQSYRLILISG